MQFGPAVLLEFAKEKNTKFNTFKIDELELSTIPCLPDPVHTDMKVIAIIISIVAFCMLTCLLDAYTHRWRSQICNMFFPKRARARALDLYKRVTVGRDHRKKYHLRTVAITEKKKNDLLLKISMLTKLEHLIRLKIKSNIDMCNGCHVREQNMKKVDFKDNFGETINVTLCNDCMKDI